MRNLTKEIENKKIDIEKLLKYGFNEYESKYLYETFILDDNFKVIIELNKDNNLISKVIESESNEEYILADVSTAKGEFVGKIKEEYENILQDIINTCTTNNIFKNKQSIEVINYIKEKYNDELEFLWKKFENNAIWRNKQNNKWYGALLIIEENKIGIESDKIIEILDLRYQKDKIKNIVDNKKIFPGYHMNKDNWITLKLDNTINTKEIYKLIDNSYNISLEK